MKLYRLSSSEFRSWRDRGTRMALKRQVFAEHGTAQLRAPSGRILGTVRAPKKSGRIPIERAKRDEVLRTLAELKALHSIAPYLYKVETIQRFQLRLRQAFLSGDRSTARVYLHNLVDRITVGEDEITIDARANAAIAMMAEPRQQKAESSSGEVLADVVDWRTP